MAIRSRLIACGLTGFVTLALSAAGASNALGAARYAAPTPQGTADCSSPANACAVKTAIEGAGMNDDVFVPGNLGDYTVSATIHPAASGIHIHGTDGRPRLLTGSVGDLRLQGSSSTAENLYMEGEGTVFALDKSGDSANNVIIKATASHACYLGGGATLTNSVCWAATGSADLGAETDGANTFRNDTLVGGTEAALKAFGRTTGCCGTQTGLDTLVNVIARGGSGVDLKAESDTTASSTINVKYSNYDPAKTSLTGSPTAINDQGANQSAAPLFANAANGDFHQAPGSPTIDHGINDAANGSTDFDGDPRTLNGITDIGADEFNPGSGGAPGPGGTLGTRPTSTVVVCNYHVATFSDTCIATVSDTGTPPAVSPTGAVGFAPTRGGGIFLATSSCALAQSATPGGLPSCSVEYLPPAVGQPRMTASYHGDSSHQGSSATTRFLVVALGSGDVVSQLGIQPPSLLAAPSGGPASSARAAVGAVVIYRLRAPARVTFTVQRPAAGRLVRTGRGRRARTTCRAPNRANRDRPKCTRWLTLRGSFSLIGTKGNNRFRFRGRIGGRTLTPGSYRLLATPSIGGVKGKPTTRNFRVKRP